MRVSNFRAAYRFTSIFRLCLCIAVIGVIILVAADRTIAATSVSGSPPEIKIFSADPLTLKDGGAALYTFVVSGATDMQVTEAGAIIKSISGPSSTNLKGTVKGRTTYQIRIGNSNTFETVLVARNRSGVQKKTLTLSFETKLPSKSAAGSTGQAGSDNQTKARTPKWGPQSLSSASFTRATTSTHNAPKFAECSSNCNYCLRPDEAAARGFTQKCSEALCYYSPDNQQKWYCYSKPATVWCCHDGKVVETTKEKCAEAGGTYYATEAEAVKACQQVIGWYCSGGKVSQGTQAQARQVGAAWYTTEAEANRACMGWYCSGGNVYPGTQSQAAQAGAAWYTTQAEATKACEQACWCCTSGRYGQTTTDACAKMGGTCYSTQSRAAAGCQPLGWFCSGSKVYQGTASQAAQAGATWYTTQADATKACVPPTTYWCCSNGQVYQTTTYTTGCYRTQAEAQQACEKASTCWCCSGGKVYQTSTAACTRAGGSCYSTQSQATAGCRYNLK
jgi:hypothetical protein